MKIYTKRGDEGMTDLFGGERVKKSHARVKAFGEVDCANTAIGVAYAAGGLDEQCKAQLVDIMKLMFCLGAEIATAQKESAQHLLERQLKNRVNMSHVEKLEHCIDAMEERLSPLKNFILPTGSDTGARLHFARTMVRKAEIALLEMVESGVEIRADLLEIHE